MNSYELITRLSGVANDWDANNTRPLPGAVVRVVGEASELEDALRTYAATGDKTELCDELGDVFCTLYRVFNQLTSDEREFVGELAQMKLDSRVANRRPGEYVKDKAAEAIKAKAIKERLGL